MEYAHQHDVTVEGELGVLAGVEDEVASEVSHYTKPEEVVDFVTKTGVDSLAISIGTSHGAYKFTPEQCTRRSQDGPSGSASPGVSTSWPPSRRSFRASPSCCTARRRCLRIR